MASTRRLDETFEDVETNTSRALDRGSAVGRYVILSRAGAGGMGVVYAAYDPDLDRRVAVKLLHPVREDSVDGVARLVREAQALAKLAHPNVVAVHDVGECDGAMYIAMEFVEGRTLQAWLADGPRPRSEIIDVLRQAGEGLAAAHDKGLVHRDFKPENVILGEDGRVRVMDFGLARVDAERAGGLIPDELEGPSAARTSLTRVGSLLGTPRYMAPEQLAGGDVGPAADQFAFCLVAYEALYGQRAFTAASIPGLLEAVSRGVQGRVPHAGVPAWLRAVVLRGLEPTVSARWPSMHALLDAMRRDPGKRRRVRLAALGTAAGALAIFGGLQAQGYARARACTDEGVALSNAWAGRRDEVQGAMLASGLGHASVTFDRTAAVLDTYAAAWGDMHEELCRAATMDATLDAPLLARANACLDDRAMQFEELVRTLANSGPADVDAAVGAAHELAALGPCARPERLVDDSDPASSIEIRTLLARSAAHRLLGKHEVARELAAEAVEAAAGPGMAVLRARAQVDLGNAELQLAEHDAASKHLQAALEGAGAIGDDEVAAEAAHRLAYLSGAVQGRVAEAEMWCRQAEMWLDRMGASPDHARRGLILSTRAAALHHGGDPKGALVLLERAVPMHERALGEDHPATAQALHERGIMKQMIGEPDGALVDVGRALEIKRRAFGPAHHETAATLASYGDILAGVGRTDEAIAALREALEIREASLGADNPDVAQSLYMLAYPLGPTDEAVALLERSRAIYARTLGAEHLAVAMADGELGGVALRRGEFDLARTRFTAALEMIERTQGPEHAVIGPVLLNLARALEQSGDAAAAEPVLVRATTILERNQAATDPTLARARTALGRVRLARGDTAGAIEALEQALGRFDALGTDDPGANEARSLLAQAHRDRA